MLQTLEVTGYMCNRRPILSWESSEDVDLPVRAENRRCSHCIKCNKNRLHSFLWSSAQFPSLFLHYTSQVTLRSFLEQFTSTSSIQKVMKFYKFGNKSFDTDLRTLNFPSSENLARKQNERSGNNLSIYK